MDHRDPHHHSQGLRPSPADLAARDTATVLLARAFDALDDVERDLAGGNQAGAAAALARCLESAAGAVCAIQTGSEAAGADPAALDRLLRSDPRFRSVRPDFIDRALAAAGVDRAPAAANREALERAAEEAGPFLDRLHAWFFDRAERDYLTAGGARERGRRRAILSWTAAAAALALILLHPVYRARNPWHPHQSNGQLFWVNAEFPEPNESASVRFKLTEDDQWRDYEVRLSRPVDMDRLRFDPAREERAQVWIDRVLYYGADGRLLGRDEFEADESGWSALNDARGLRTREGALYFETSGDDPILMRDGLNLAGVSRLVVRMRVTLRQSYVQWLFS